MFIDTDNPIFIGTDTMKVSSNTIAVKFFSQKAMQMMNHGEQPQRVMPKSTALWNSTEVD